MMQRRWVGMLLTVLAMLWLSCDGAHSPAPSSESSSETSLVTIEPSSSTEVLGARSSTGLAYDLQGDGPLVVLIHGTNLDRRMWADEVAWLRESSKVLAYDMRGQGKSDDPKENFSNHGDLLALLDELAVSDATLVGLSAGSQVALDVALTAPERVRRLVLVAPSLVGYVPTEMPAFFGELGTALQAGDFEAANAILLASPVLRVPDGAAEQVRTMVEDNTRLWTLPYSLVEQASPPAFERLGEVTVPTLILVGDQDMSAVREQGGLLEEQIPDAQRVEVPGGGHLLNLTSPKMFQEALRGFLEVG